MATDDFSKPKLFYADICQTLCFSLCTETVFGNNTTYFISSNDVDVLSYIAKFINHKLYNWYYRTISVQLGTSAVRMFSIYVLNLPISKELVAGDIYETYGLNDTEIDFIESL
ncbi:MAG: hypothetical protein K2H32_01570 [Muribaculaceae bacterium]|nr:hypothetical protein [Muribaculaceae bacterium]